MAELTPLVSRVSRISRVSPATTTNYLLQLVTVTGVKHEVEHYWNRAFGDLQLLDAMNFGTLRPQASRADLLKRCLKLAMEHGRFVDDLPTKHDDCPWVR